MILVRPLHPTGEHSRSLVLPKLWFIQLGQPKKVRIIVGRRLAVYAAEVGDDGDGKERGTEAD